MLTRQVGGQVFNLGYDAENRMTSVSGAAGATFKYNGYGARVIATEGGATTVFIGNHFEWTGTITDTVKYYYAGTVRVAMRKGADDPVFLLGDHLGSTSVAYDGASASHQGYKPWGETRFVDGTLPTQYQFTGQYNQQSIGLYYYGARWYDGYISQFSQPDPLIPNPYNPLDWNRFSDVRYNPIKYIDPTGHCGINPDGTLDDLDCTEEEIDSWSMEYRLQWFKLFLDKIDSLDLVDRWFNNIKGILDAFISEGIGQTGSWISWVDAGILVSIQNGYVQYKRGIDGLSGAADEWQEFFDAFFSGAESSALSQIWGKAEQAGTQFGLGLASSRDIYPSLRERVFLEVGDTYRGIMATPNGGYNFGSWLGGAFGSKVAPSCSGCNPICSAVNQTYVEIGAAAGGAFGNWITDPRASFFGEGPVYYIAVLILGQ